MAAAMCGNLRDFSTYAYVLLIKSLVSDETRSEAIFLFSKIAR